MSVLPVRVAVVGHTNTGKTSLLRTLLRDVSFGEVSDRPATTRHVEAAALLVDGEPHLLLFDTPGLEDSISLLERLDALGRGAASGRPDWPSVVRSFLESPDGTRDFDQEVKALRQVLESDIALYVIDARERVLGRHRDELEILTRCARPVVPVLNFTASDEARSDEWRDQLARLNLHAVAEFDTVVLDEHGERRLFEKMQTLLERRRDVLERLIEDRRRLRQRLLRLAARVAAEMLIDVAAAVSLVPEGDPQVMARRIEEFKEGVRRREQSCLRQLLDLFHFRPDDGRLRDVPIEEGRWGMDVFDPIVLRQFGIRAGSAVAAGAAAGLVVDAMLHGLSLGAFTATGAALGALWQTGRSYGRRLIDRARGIRELRCEDATLRLLLARQVALVRALVQRGHAAVQPLVIDARDVSAAAGGMRGGGAEERWDQTARAAGKSLGRDLAPELLQARANPGWSRLGPSPQGGAGPGILGDAGRSAAERALAERLVKLAGPG